MKLFDAFVFVVCESVVLINLVFWLSRSRLFDWWSFLICGGVIAGLIKKYSKKDAL